MCLTASSNFLRIHTGEKPFSCKLCNAKFNQSSALMRHAKQHTSDFNTNNADLAPLLPAIVEPVPITTIPANGSFLSCLNHPAEEPLHTASLPNIMTIHPMSTVIDIHTKPTSDQRLNPFGGFHKHGTEVVYARHPDEASAQHLMDFSRPTMLDQSIYDFHQAT